MGNLQEFMQTVLERRTPPATVALYGAWVTPRGGVPVYTTIRSSLGVAHVRLEVQRGAIRRYGSGFTFAVRPL